MQANMGMEEHTSLHLPTLYMLMYASLHGKSRPMWLEVKNFGDEEIYTLLLC